MFRSRLLLVSVAFGVGFGLSLWLSRSFGLALLAGCVTVPATVTGVFAMNLHRWKRLKQFEGYQAGLQESLSAIAVECHKEEARLSSLKIELGQLQIQIANQRQQREELNRQLASMTGQKYLLETGRATALPQARATQDEQANRGKSQTWGQGQSLLQTQPVAPTMLLTRQAPELETAAPVAVNQQIQPGQVAGQFQIQKQAAALGHHRAPAQLEQKSQQLQKTLQRLKQEQGELQQSLAELKQERKTLTQSLVDLDAEQSELQQSLAALKQEQTDLTQSLAGMETERRELKQSLTSLEAKHQQAEAILPPLRDEYRRLQSQVSTLKREAQQLQGKATKSSRPKKKSAGKGATVPGSTTRNYRQGTQSVGGKTASRSGGDGFQQRRQDYVSTIDVAAVPADSPTMTAAVPDVHLSNASPAGVDAAGAAVVDAAVPAIDSAPAIDPVSEADVSGTSVSGTSVSEAVVATDLNSSGVLAEWVALKSQLPDPEFRALKAILEEDNPAPMIKQIAETEVTMPALLVDGINEHALETVGDIIVEPGSGSVPPAIAPEHLEQVRQLIAERNL